MMSTKHETASTDFHAQIEAGSRAAEQARGEEKIIKTAVLRLNGHLLGFIAGTIAALLLFAATNWLVFKGGDEIGPHLGLLNQFFYGYSVTFTGSLIGAAYAFTTGYLSGLFVGWIYNWVIFFKSK